MSEFGASATGRRFGCPGCGGGLRYDITAGSMICDRCGEHTPIQRLQDAPAEQNMMEVTEYHCPQCGAVIYSTDTSATGFCSFCGSDVILTGKLGKTRRPSAIVPFSVTREACEAAYREHLKHYRLMPSELKSTETISHFRPVYVPFWSYHVQSEGVAELKGTKSYTRGNTRYDEDYDLSMHAEINQRGILYDASSAFEDETAAMLQHTADETVPFHAAYLSGFYAQAADVPQETYEDEAAATAVRMFMNRVKEEYAMDSVEMTGDIQNAFGLPNARYEAEMIMMPVWLLAHRQGERVIYTAVNGSNGRVVCDVPVSNGKLAAVTLALAAVLFLLLHLFLTVKPDLLMVICGVLLLITQFQFSAAQTALNNRRTRAFEPDYSGSRPTFTGPAQALLKRKGDRVALAGSALQKGAQLGGILLSVAGIALAGFLFTSGPSLFSRLFNLNGSSGHMLLAMAMVLILIIMIVHTVIKVRKGGSGPMIPRILALVACGAGVFFLLQKNYEDLLYYGCAAAMLLAAAWELVTITRAHNEYASRPVPFFQEENT